MRNYLYLTKVLFINTFRFLYTNKSKKYKSILFILFILISLLPFTFGIGKFISKAYDLLIGINQEGIILGFSLSIISTAIFFFGIFYIISTFYLSKDIEYLLPLPFKPSEILCAKFTIALFYEYISQFIFLTPILIAFGLKSNSGLLYYIYSIIAFLALPIIPLIIASILDMIIMQFTNITKNKDLFRIISGIISIFLAIGLNLSIQNYGTIKLDQNQLLNLLNQGNNSLLAFSSKLFPSIKLIVYSLVNNSQLTGILYLLAFLLINIFCIVIFIVIGNLLYFKGALGASETYSKGVQDITKLNKSIKHNLTFISYTSKEFKILFRTPVYFMNCVLMNFLWPIFIILPFIFQPDTKKDLDKYLTLIQTQDFYGVVITIILIFGIFITSANGITATSISREGQNYYIDKYIPMSYKLQIFSKILSGALTGFIGTLFLLLIIIFLFKIPLFLVFIGLFVSILGILFSASIGIFIDLISPKLVWDSEQKAVKQNFNILYNLVIGILFSFVTAYSMIMLKPDLWSTIIILILSYGILNFVLYRILITKGIKLYSCIESQ